MRRVVALLAPYKWPLLVVGLAVIVAAGLTTVAPFLTRAVFDNALFPAGPGGIGRPNLHLLYWLIAGLVAVPLISSLIGVGQTYLTTKVGNSAMADLRVALFSHLEKMELAFFTATRTGDIQSRLANDVSGVRNILTSTAVSIVSNVVTVVAAFVSMVVMSWQLTIITLILMPLFMVIQVRVGARRKRLQRKTQENLSDMTAITEESLGVSGVLLAKVFNRADLETERYAKANRRQTRLQLKNAMAGQTFFSIVSTFFGLTPAIVYLVAGLLINGGTLIGGAVLTAGTIVAFTTLQARLQQPLVSLMRVSLDVQTSFALFARLFEYLDLEPAIKDKPGAVTLIKDSVAGAVEFRDVWFRYPAARPLNGDGHIVDDERWTLAGISFQVKPGTLAALVGPSGSGKTTLTYLIPRLYDATKGQVLIDGHDVTDVSVASLIDTVGMVTQEPYLFHGTITENLRYARPDVTDAEIVEACRAANIHDRIMSFADGYETITGERGFRLSGGEKQRLSIARVLIKDPKILILDEATSALDTATERLVQEALERAVQSRTTFAIAHRLSTIINADIIFGIDAGRLVEQGTHDELLAKDGLYARLYHEQFEDATGVA